MHASGYTHKMKYWYMYVLGINVFPNNHLVNCKIIQRFYYL